MADTEITGHLKPRNLVRLLTDAQIAPQDAPFPTFAVNASLSLAFPISTSRLGSSLVVHAVLSSVHKQITLPEVDCGIKFKEQEEDDDGGEEEGGHERKTNTFVVISGVEGKLR